jgi:hypothetical protein
MSNAMEEFIQGGAGNLFPPPVRLNALTREPQAAAA